MKVSAEPPVFFEEVLVTRSDLEEKTALTAELRTRVEELKMENEYQLRLKVFLDFSPVPKKPYFFLGYEL